MKLREMVQWLLKLLPKQKMQDLGDGNVQVGRVGGDLQHSQHTTTYNTFYVVGAPPASTVPNSNPATPAQHEVLELMRTGAAARAYTEAFMKKEFKSVVVKRMNDQQCRRTVAYVQACLKNEAAKVAELT